MDETGQTSTGGGFRGNGRYALERVLGHGGMATVFLASDTVLDRRVALKSLAGNVAADPELRARFLREARFAARLVHPNVVQVYDAGEDEEGPYLVMEVVDGETLAATLARRGHLPPAEIVVLGIELCSALAAAHAGGIVHRDVKPQNVLLGRDGAVKLADFGIARSHEATALTQAGSVLGTAAYLAPEQARGEPAGPAADLYALGVVLYEALAGRRPYEAGSLHDLVLLREREPPVPPRVLAPDVPAELDASVLRCLALDPAGRPASAAALARDLASSLDPVETRRLPAVGPESVTAVVPRRRRRRLAPAAAALALVAALALGLALVLRSGGGHAAAPPPTTTVRTTTTVRITTTPAQPSPAPVSRAPAPPPAVDPCASVDAAARQLDERRHGLDEEKKGASK